MGSSNDSLLGQGITVLIYFWIVHKEQQEAIAGCLPSNITLLSLADLSLNQRLALHHKFKNFLVLLIPPRTLNVNTIWGWGELQASHSFYKIGKCLMFSNTPYCTAISRARHPAKVQDTPIHTDLWEQHVGTLTHTIPKHAILFTCVSVILCRIGYYVTLYELSLKPHIFFIVLMQFQTLFSIFSSINPFMPTSGSPF